MTKNLRAQFLLIVSVIATRLPFLFNGYGNEEDSWTHVVNAFEIFSSGKYIMSRLPGHPLMEGLLAAIWPFHSPFTYNLLAMMGCVFSTLMVYKIHVQLKGIYPFLTALLFSFFPVVFASSVSTIDYLIGFALVLAAFYQVINKKLITAAILLGLAVGFRLSHLAWGLPLLLWMVFDYKANLKKILQFSLIVAIVTILCYLPVYLTYGVAFFDTYSLPYPPLSKVIYKASIGVFGILGLISVGILKLNWFIENKNNQLSKAEWATFISWIVISVAIYGKIPEKSAFILPIIPIVLWWLVRGEATKKVRWALIIGLMSPWLLGIDINDPYRGSTPSPLALTFDNFSQEIFIDPLSGPIINDATKRIKKANTTEQLVTWMNEEKDSTLFIAGWWFPMIQVHYLENPNKTTVTPVYYATEKQILAARNRGLKIKYAPEQERINLQKYQHDLVKRYGEPVF